MKILYVTNYDHIAKHSGGFINDYMNDLVFFGLLENGVEIVDWPNKIIHLYNEFEYKIPKQNLWGLGFSQTFLINGDPINRLDIDYKIEHNYFDYIIFGAIQRYNEPYNYIKKYYNDHQIICIDGNDDCNINTFYSDKHLYFKREIYTNYLPNNVIPIHFAIPQIKINQINTERTQEYSNSIPGNGYNFNNEHDYYNDYAKSYYGVTMKKAGWDCMRHYEIIANNCLPYFINIENCPVYTLNQNFKNHCVNAFKIANNYNDNDYYDCLLSFKNLLITELTTKKIGNQILNYLK